MQNRPHEQFIYIYIYIYIYNTKSPQGRLGPAGLNCSIWLLETPHLSSKPTSSPLGSAGAPEMAARASSARLGRSKWAARARSAPLGRSKWPLELARLLKGARSCSAWLLENTAPADVSEFEAARLHWGARHWRSSPLGPPGPETLHWAGPRMPVALNTETNILVHGMHGSTLL